MHGAHTKPPITSSHRLRGSAVPAPGARVRLRTAGAGKDCHPEGANFGRVISGVMSSHTTVTGISQ